MNQALSPLPNLPARNCMMGIPKNVPAFGSGKFAQILKLTAKAGANAKIKRAINKAKQLNKKHHERTVSHM